MAQYTKHNSNYIRTGTHKTLKDGSTIFERDWVTVGSQLHFGSGKTPYYTNGNFIFTTSSVPQYQKKHKNGTYVGTWTYEDVKDASSTVNSISDDEYTEDIRSFVYYGSCVELVRSSIEHIIQTFPGNITLSNEKLIIDEETSKTLVSNPFAIDLITEVTSLKHTENELRFMSRSWDKYLINGEDIKRYTIVWEEDIDKNCPPNNEYDIRKKPVVRVTIYDGIKYYDLYGYQVYNEILFCYDEEALDIRPKQDIIEDYFNNLKGFEKQLLNRQSFPLYSNSFITPIEVNLGYLYYKRTYTWPSNDYCIDIISPSYIDFINRLTSMAELFDSLWTDNIWRRMTHEAIKNYDWTYTKEYEEGEEEDNVEGGERMHKVLNIIGRVFDDIKKKIDIIKQKNKISYCPDRNIPNALLNDKLELMGWEVYSTIPTYENSEGVLVSANDVKIDDNFLQEYGIWWYETKNNNEYSFADANINFMRKLALSSKYIFQTKGTKSAIDMVMAMFGYGEDFYEITETYRTVVPIDYYDDGVTEIPEGAEELPILEPIGDKIVRLNNIKPITKLYNDDVSGIPVGSFILQEKAEDESTRYTTYLIPYYDQKRIYDGNFTFQSKGGWMGNNPMVSSITVDYDKFYFKGGEYGNYQWISHFTTDEVVTRDRNPNIGDIVFINDEQKSITDVTWETWTETVSYLHVISKIENLFEVNPNSVAKGDIYYVVNVSDFNYYFGESVNINSHFFAVIDDFDPSLTTSWSNIDLDDSSNEMSKKAKYLDNIILDTIGNNPHVGYGKYDKGETFFDYMRKPFKYAIENYYFNGSDEEDANSVTFDVSEEIKGDKIMIFDKNENNEENKQLTYETYYVNIYDVNAETLTEEEYNSLEIENKEFLYKKYKTYNDDKVTQLQARTYYLNDKVVYFKNLCQNDEYIKYFKNIIIKYLMQVIPSTTILILEDF